MPLGDLKRWREHNHDAQRGTPLKERASPLLWAEVVVGLVSLALLWRLSVVLTHSARLLVLVGLFDMSPHN